jgi:histidine triad (HIT) family protein
VRGEIPARIVATNDRAIAFADINPQAPVHLVLIPRVHVDSVQSLDVSTGETLADLVRLAQSIAGAEGFAERGYRLVVNHGPDAGQSVAHLHLHLLSGRSMGWPPG